MTEKERGRADGEEEHNRKDGSSVSFFRHIFDHFSYGDYFRFSDNGKKEMENIENAVVQAAVFCYGTEGAYPESLAYLRQHYGLRYDEKKYIVEYEVIGKNIRPQIRVMRLTQEEK